MVCNADSVLVSSGDDVQQQGSQRQDADEFSAEKFIDRLMNEGTHVSCDDTSEAFNMQGVPFYYDEEKYKKGQSFFYKHMFGLFLGKLLGLMSILSMTSSLRILILTNMSSSNYTAYRRYMATIFHMCIWYEDTLKPNSRLWHSISDIRNRHNLASKKAYCCLNYRINQKDMALTQFGFMGFALVRSEAIGVYKATDEELEGFIHLWRVIGHILGIEERFNICRESLQETKEICNVIIAKVLHPAVQRQEREYVEMSSYLINGMWVMNPALNYNVFSFYLQMVLENKYEEHQIDRNDMLYKKMSKKDLRLLYGIVMVLGSLKHDILRWIYSHVQLVSLWLMKYFPFLAYYMYGRKNAHVKILPVSHVDQ